MGGTVALRSVNKKFSGELQFCSYFHPHYLSAILRLGELIKSSFYILCDNNQVWANFRPAKQFANVKGHPLTPQWLKRTPIKSKYNITVIISSKVTVM